MELDWRSTAWTCCQKGSGIHFAPRLDRHPCLEGLRKAAELSGELLDAIEKDALSGESSPVSACLGTYSEDCISSRTCPRGWRGTFASALSTQCLVPVLSFLHPRPGEPQSGSKLPTLKEGQGNRGPLQQPGEEALGADVLPTLKMKQTE